MEMIICSIQLAGANFDFKVMVYGVLLLHRLSALAPLSLWFCGPESLHTL